GSRADPARVRDVPGAARTERAELDPSRRRSRDARRGPPEPRSHRPLGLPAAPRARRLPEADLLLVRHGGPAADHAARRGAPQRGGGRADRKSTRLNSSHEWISYAV